MTGTTGEITPKAFMFLSITTYLLPHYGSGMINPPNNRKLNLSQLRKSKAWVQAKTWAQEAACGRLRRSCCTLHDADDNEDSEDETSQPAASIIDTSQLSAAAVNGRHEFMQYIGPDVYSVIEDEFNVWEDEHKRVVGHCTLAKFDLCTLDGCNWLNDLIMHGYLGLLASERNEQWHSLCHSCIHYTVVRQG